MSSQQKIQNVHGLAKRVVAVPEAHARPWMATELAHGFIALKEQYEEAQREITLFKAVAEANGDDYRRLKEQLQTLHKSAEQALAALEDDGILWISAAAILRAAVVSGPVTDNSGAEIAQSFVEPSPATSSAPVVSGTPDLASSSGGGSEVTRSGSGADSSPASRLHKLTTDDSENEPPDVRTDDDFEV